MPAKTSAVVASGSVGKKKTASKKKQPGEARLQAIKNRVHADSLTTAAFYRVVHRGQTERVDPATKKLIDDMICEHVDHVIDAGASFTEARGNNMITMQDTCEALSTLGHPIAGRTRPKPKPKAKKVTEGETAKDDTSEASDKKSKSKTPAAAKDEKSSKKTSK